MRNRFFRAEHQSEPLHGLIGKSSDRARRVFRD